MGLKRAPSTPRKGRFVALLFNRAGWQGYVIVPDNITPMRSPPFRPELNPNENIAKSMRECWLQSGALRESNFSAGNTKAHIPFRHLFASSTKRGSAGC